MQNTIVITGFLDNTLTLFRDSLKKLIENILINEDKAEKQNKIQISQAIDSRLIIKSKEFISNAKIIIFVINLTNSESDDYLNEAFLKCFHEIFSDDQQIILIGRIFDENFNRDECLSKIITIKNALHCYKYFEEENGVFSLLENQIGPLTILPNFYGHFNKLIKDIIYGNFSNNKKITITDDKSLIRFILTEKTRTAEIIQSKHANGIVNVPDFIENDYVNYFIHSIADNAFENTSITVLSLKNTHIKRIGNFIFQDSSIEEIIFGESIEEFGKYWCKGVEKLTKITIDPNNKHFIYKEGLLINIKENEIIFAKRDIMGKITFWNDIKKIGPYAFYKCKNVEKFSIKSSSIEQIEDFAFYQCDNLKSFTIAKTINLKIGKYCFAESHNLENFVIECENIKFGKNCFENCSLLYIVSLKHSKTINFGFQSFNNCKGISTISIENAESITIKNECFLGCNSIKNICFKTENLSLYEDSFKNCTSINIIIIRCNNNMIFTQDTFKELNFLAFIDIYSSSNVTLKSNCFNDSNLLETIIINCDNFNIEENCFTNHVNLSKLSIECQNDINIPQNEFLGCNSLNYVHLTTPQSIMLPQNCFKCFKKLQKVELVGKNIEIKDECFYDCSLLKSLIIQKPMNLKIGNDQFFNCLNLTNLKIEAISKIELVCNCFNGAENIEIIQLEAKNVKINDNCFNKCTSLKSLIIQKSRNITIGSNQFINCPNLSKIRLFVNSGLNLGFNCFNGAEKLDTIEIIGGDINIDNDALANCFSLCYLSIFNVNNVRIGANQLNNCKIISRIIIESSSNISIDDEVFLSAKNLNQIILSGKDIIIGSKCFSNCQNLEKVDFLNANTVDLHSAAFSKCKKINDLNIFALSSINLDNECFFGNEKLTSVILNSENICIRLKSFQNCYSLTSLTISAENQAQNIDIYNHSASHVSSFSCAKLVLIDESAFENCKKMRELNISAENEVKIGNRCFYYNKKLFTATIRCKYVEINDFSFSKCPSLFAINLQNAINPIVSPHAFDRSNVFIPLNFNLVDEYETSSN